MPDTTIKLKSRSDWFDTTNERLVYVAIVKKMRESINKTTFTESPPSHEARSIRYLSTYRKDITKKDLKTVVFGDDMDNYGTSLINKCQEFAFKKMMNHAENSLQTFHADTMGLISSL